MTDDPDDQDYTPFGRGETVAEPGQQEGKRQGQDDTSALYQDAEWLYQQYAILGKTLQEIAEGCGVREKTIWRWVQKFDIDTRSGGPRPGPWKDENWLRSQYIDQQKSIYQIAEEQDCDEKTIRNWLTEHGIDARDYSERHPASRDDRRYRDEGWLRDQYVENERTAAEIADQCGVGESTIYDWLDRHGIETRSVAEARQLTEARSVRLSEDEQNGGESESVIEREAGQGQYEGPETGIDVSYQSNLADRDQELVESPYRDGSWLRDMYEQTGSGSEIAELCDVDRGTIYYWMDKHGIERTQGNENARYRNEDWLREAYDDLGTLEAVADECSVAAGTIRNWLDRFNIERNPDAVDANSGGRSKKTLGDFADAVIWIYNETGSWPDTGAYRDQKEADDPSVGTFYRRDWEGVDSWSDLIDMAKKEYEEKHVDNE